MSLSSPSKSSIGLGGGLVGGFFSGSDTSLWAPSPKTNTTTQAPPMAGRAERFTFDTANSGQQRADTTVDLSAAWAADREADRAAHFGPSLTVEERPRSRAPSPRAAIDGPRLTTGSPSPDAHMPTSVVQTLWLSPTPVADTSALAAAFAPPSGQDILGQRASPGQLAGPTTTATAAQADTDWKVQLSSHLQCAYPLTPTSPSHLLSTPISTPCCGVSLCQACVPAHLSQCATTLQTEKQQSEDEKHSATAPEQEAPIGKCSCGRTLHSADADHLRNAPVNKALDEVTKLVSSTTI